EQIGYFVWDINLPSTLFLKTITRPLIIGLLFFTFISTFLILIARSSVQSIMRNEQRFRSLFENAFHAVVIHRGFDILHFNQSFVRTYQIGIETNRETLSLKNFISIDVQKKMERTWNRIIQGQSSESLEPHQH